jgi:hypothetical protein
LFEVSAVRAGSYLVKVENEFRFVNFSTGKYAANENASVFLKQGYFEDPGELSETVLAKIDAIISDDKNRMVF